MGLDFRPTASSPVVDAGLNLGTAYQIDINGLNQNSYGSGWEIGAHAYAAYSSYGQTNPPMGSYFCDWRRGADLGGAVGFANVRLHRDQHGSVELSYRELRHAADLGFAAAAMAVGQHRQAGVFNFTALDAMLAQDYSNTSCGPPTYPCSNQTKSTVQTPTFPPISTTPTQSYQGAFAINSIGYDGSGLNPIGQN